MRKSWHEQAQTWDNINDGEDLTKNMNQLGDEIQRRVISGWVQLMRMNTGEGSEADGRAGETEEKSGITWQN